MTENIDKLNFVWSKAIEDRKCLVERKETLDKYYKSLIRDDDENDEDKIDELGFILDEIRNIRKRIERIDAFVQVVVEYSPM